MFVIKNDEPTYVILDPARYNELLDAAHEGFVAGVKESLEDYRAGRSRITTAQEMIDEFGLRD